MICKGLPSSAGLSAASRLASCHLRLDPGPRPWVWGRYLLSPAIKSATPGRLVLGPGWHRDGSSWHSSKDQLRGTAGFKMGKEEGGGIKMPGFEMAL